MTTEAAAPDTTSGPVQSRSADEAAAQAALTCAGLVHVYRVAGTDIAALRGVDLRVGQGERVALLGPSGSGKSTLLAVVAGILRPSAGTVNVFGTDLAGASESQLRRFRAATVGLMLQGAATNLLLFADARDNVRYALRSLPSQRRADAHVGERVLQATGLSEDRRPVGGLSPSRQQAVALAVAMATTPRLLLVDEPTSQLDDAARDVLLDILVHVTAENGITVLMVTHDEQVARRMGRMVHLRDGRVGAEATTGDRYAVIGADGSVQLPEELLPGWPAGSLVEVDGVGPDEVRIRRANRP